MSPQFSRHFAGEGQFLQLQAAAADLENEQAVVDVEAEQQEEDGNQRGACYKREKDNQFPVCGLTRGRGGAGRT